MKTYRIIILSVMAMVSVCMSAQPKDVKVLAKGSVSALPLPEMWVDSRTGKVTARWHGTNNDWITDSCWAKTVHVAENISYFYPNTPFDEELMSIVRCSGNDLLGGNYVPMTWMLTEEGGETVLHCYLRMPADVLTHLWLASEETCLVDRATGVQYRIRRTEPECTSRHLCLKGKKGEVIDLRIYFPPLPETVTDVTLFGVSAWNIYGERLKLKYRASGQFHEYDTIPRLRQPRLLKEHLSENAPYDRQNWNTWRVYTDAHLVQPHDDYTMALWLTPEATYLALEAEQNWTREYFGFNRGVMLVDDAGQQYPLRAVEGLPMGELFFMEGNAGDYVAFMLRFDPMPPNTSTFTYIEPDSEPFSAWGANWQGDVRDNLNVQQLRANQTLFRYLPRQVVK